MVSSPKPPPAPDPYATANAQSGMNRDTALTQQMLNMVNQQGPWGSVNYNQTGSTWFTDSSGKRVQVPTFTQTTTFSPEQQAIFDKTTEAQTNLSELAATQSEWMQGYLQDPFEFDNQDAVDWTYDLAASRILPQQEEANRDLRTQLINQGIRPGTAAYDREMMRLSRANNDQMNGLMLDARAQAFNEAAYERNAPINELSAFLSGSQVSAPNTGMSGTPQTSVGGVDYAGLVNNNFNQQMSLYNNQMANRGAALGGLFGLAGSLGSGFLMR